MSNRKFFVGLGILVFIFILGFILDFVFGNWLFSYIGYGIMLFGLLGLFLYGITHNERRRYE